MKIVMNICFIVLLFVVYDLLGIYIHLTLSFIILQHLSVHNYISLILSQHGSCVKARKATLLPLRKLCSVSFVPRSARERYKSSSLLHSTSFNLEIFTSRVAIPFHSLLDSLEELALT